MRWTFEVVESVRIAWASLRANRLRSLLTMLGIVVGIVTVTLMGMAIEGLNNAFRNSISSLGADALYVQRTPWAHLSYQEWQALMRRRRLDLQLARAVERRLTNAAAIAPITQGLMSVSYKNRSARGVTVVGTTEQYQITAGLSLTDGRFLSAADVEGGRPVCVIGSQVASNLFVRDAPVGARLRLGGQALEVIGVLEKRGNFLGTSSLDNLIMIPARLFVETFDWDPEFSLNIKADGVAGVDRLVDELRGVLRVLRKLKPGDPDDFSINQQQTILEAFGRVSGVIGSVGLFISGLSLFVGGIGIMNIMFVSVAERTREIGIRKAIGAKRRAILMQFLTEASAICLFAGLLGLGIAWGASFALSSVMPVSLSYRIAGLAIAVSITVGLIAGFLPAWRAARMNPVDALRNE